MIRKIKSTLVIVFAVFFICAGVSHFIADDSYANIVPPILPFPFVIVWITGLIEIALGVMLLCPHFRPRVGILLGLFLLCVLPANIYMAMERIPFGGFELNETQLWGRVGLQLPLIAIIYWCTRANKVS